MKCPKCQHENPDAQKFCGECGNKLTSSQIVSSEARSFNEKIDKIQRYLPKGLTEKILAQRGKIEGENKQVTVMFCDMEGFTPLVEKLGREKAYSIMDEVYEILIHKVHEFEGTVNEMTGDGIMALFGAPIALEDAPQRALRSALAIHQDIANFNRNQKTTGPIKMRIGIHTGPVVVGTLGNDLRVEFKAVGDTVNLASRMEGLAEPGTTCLTEETYKLTEGLFRFEAIGEREVKGKEEAVPVYKLLSAKKEVHRPRLGLERSIYSEMVGRNKELNRLELQVMKAINGEGSIVNIIGEAGIGKSRLIAELKNREVMKQVSLFEGRAIATGRNLSFHPIINLLKQWARIGEDDSGATALTKIETSIRRVIPEDSDEVLPFVATLMGMKLSGRYAKRIEDVEGEALEKLIMKNIRDIIIKATELKPQVIVMEDLHWSDTSSIELNVTLFRLAETQRIVFINVLRPGYKETGDKIVKNSKESLSDHYVEINLQPLDDSMSETLINNMLHIRGLKHNIIDQIVDRADGNPFFIEEVVRSLIDHGAVVLMDGYFEVTEKIDTMVIPHSINDVLMARIDRLEEKTRDLVKVASVIGRSFFYRILAEVAKMIEDIDDRLSYLKGIELIREQKRMDELEYLFKHALAQEVAYESILHQTRMDFHIKVANSIEKVFKERLHEFYGMLAYHYSKGEDLAKSEEYMIKAGELALSSSASSEALNYYKDALDLYLKKYGDTADPEKLGMLEKNIALALYYKGEYQDALLYFDSFFNRLGIKSPEYKSIVLLKFIFDLLIVILRLYIPSKKPKKVPSNRENEIISLSECRNMILVATDTMRNVTERIRRIKEIFKLDVTKTDHGLFTLLTGSSLFCYTGLSFRISKKFLDYSERFVNINSSKDLFLFNYFNLLYAYLAGNWGDIPDYDESMLNKNMESGRFWEITQYLVCHHNIKTYQGEFKTAYDLVKKLSNIADAYEHEFTKIQLSNCEIQFHISKRKLYDAQKSLEKWESQTGVWGADLNQLLYLGMDSQIEILLNNMDSARESLNKAEEFYKKQKVVVPWIASSYLTPRLYFDIRLLEDSILSTEKSKISKNRKKAFTSVKKALRNTKKYGPTRIETQRLTGIYYWLIGKQHVAVKFWKKAIEKGQQMGTNPDVARTYMEIGKRFLEAKSKYKELNGISSEGYLEKARVMFQEMDLQWDLDELDKISMAS